MDKTTPKPLIFQFILEHLNWSGNEMIFPYIMKQNNKQRNGKAVLRMSDLYRIIKWE